MYKTRNCLKIQKKSLKQTKNLKSVWQFMNQGSASSLKNVRFDACIIPSPSLMGTERALMGWRYYVIKEIFNGLTPAKRPSGLWGFDGVSVSDGGD